MSIRRDHPHLEVHVVPPELTVQAERLVEAFRALGRSAIRSG
jgi:hypothetical protein